jgi:hypothetical protein
VNLIGNPWENHGNKAKNQKPLCNSPKRMPYIWDKVYYHEESLQVKWPRNNLFMSETHITLGPDFEMLGGGENLFQRR